MDGVKSAVAKLVQNPIIRQAAVIGIGIVCPECAPYVNYALTATSVASSLADVFSDDVPTAHGPVGGVSNAPIRHPARFNSLGGAKFNQAAAAVIGGTAAELGGGKFANGTNTGAFSRLFNDEAHRKPNEDTLFERLRSSLSNFFSPDDQIAQVRGRFGLFASIDAKVAGIVGITAEIDVVSMHSGSNPGRHFPLITNGGGIVVSLGKINLVNFSATRISRNGGRSFEPWTRGISHPNFDLNDGDVNLTLGGGLLVGGAIDIPLIQAAQ